MNVPPSPPIASGDRQDALAAPAPSDDDPAAAERRRRLAEQIVAGMLPATTADERPDSGADSGFSEQWYRENRPPHHG